MAVDFVHLEADVVPVDGGGWRGSGRGVEAVGAAGGHCFLLVSWWLRLREILMVKLECVSQSDRIRGLP